MKKFLAIFLLSFGFAVAQIGPPGMVTGSGVGASGSAAPSGAAGGVLGGTYPNPSFASIAAYSILSNNTASSAAPVANTTLVLGIPGYVETGYVMGQITASSALQGNNFAVFAIQGLNAGNAASTDFVANADNATTTTHYVDMGINSSTNSTGTYPTGANASFVEAGSDALYVGTVASQTLHLFTNSIDFMTATGGGTLAFPLQTTNGFVKFTGGNGTIGVDTTAYGTGTVTTVSVTTANGVSGVVATATTTPAITITLGAITPTTVNASGNVTAQNALSVGGTAYSFGALPSGATTSGPVITMPATTYTVTGTNTATTFQANYFGVPTFTDASAGTVTDLFNTVFAGPAVAAGSLTATRVHTLGVYDTTTATTAGTGAVVIANSPASGTGVGIGAGNIFASGIITANGGVLTNNSVNSTASALILGVSGGTEVARLASATVFQMSGTNQVKFGATAASTIAVSADTTAGVLTFTAPSAGSFAFAGGNVSVGGTAYSFGALPSGATTTGTVLTMPATTYTVTGTNTATAFQANYFGTPTFTDASVGTVTDLFNSNFVGPAAVAGSLVGTRKHTVGVLDATSASSSIIGGFVVAATYGTTATSTAIGGGNINTGGTLTVGGTSTFTGAVTETAKTSTYNNVATAGWGLPAIYNAGRVTAQAAANASIATYTCGAADGSFDVSANMNVTVSTTLVTTLTCTYTDESNTVRTMIFPVQQLAGSFIAAGAITGTGAWETPTIHIRVKASSVITILTSAGTFTGVTYTAEGLIIQTS